MRSARATIPVAEIRRLAGERPPASNRGLYKMCRVEAIGVHGRQRPPVTGVSAENCRAVSTPQRASFMLARCAFRLPGKGPGKGGSHHFLHDEYPLLLTP